MGARTRADVSEQLRKVPVDDDSVALSRHVTARGPIRWRQPIRARSAALLDAALTSRADCGHDNQGSLGAAGRRACRQVRRARHLARHLRT
ncbi:hypothetical protein ACFPRL_13520 [Pseudoclavibacter helvolus]